MEVVLLAQEVVDTALTDSCGDPPGVVCHWIYDLTGSGTTAKFVEWLLAKPLKVAFILLAAFVLNRLLRRAIRRLVNRLIEQREERAHRRAEEEVEDGRFAALRERAMEKANFLAGQAERGKQRAQALGTVLRSITSLLIYGTAIVIVLGEFGVNLGPLVAGAGIVGVALGFGAQSLVRDFLSGIFMLIEDQYGVGDIVDVGDATGVVEEIKLRTTRLRDINGTVWFIPNGEIRRVGNKSQQWARAVLDIGVAYNTDIGHAIRVIKEVADGIWQEQLESATVLEEPEIWGVEELGDNAIAIRLVFKVEPGEQFATARETRRRIKAAFDREGIEIPFPQRTVWMATEPQEPIAQSEDDTGHEAKGAAEDVG
jgi:small-conductance mechanosensitive channel